jgi:hypothetical protein
VVDAQNRVETGHGGIRVVLRVELEELGLRQIHVGEAEIQGGLKFVARHLAYLSLGGLARIDGLTRHIQLRLRGQGIVEGLVGGQHDFLGRRERAGVRRLLLQLAREHEVVGVPEVIDELRKVCAPTYMLEQA